MRIQSLFLLVLSVYAATIANLDVVAERTVLETPSARVKLPSNLKWLDDGIGLLVYFSPYAFVDGQVYRISDVSVAVVSTSDKDGECGVGMMEFLVPKELASRVVADHLANSLTSAMIFTDMTVSRELNYQIKCLPTKVSDAAQYQVVQMVSSPSPRERVVGWVALYWRSDRVVALILSRGQAAYKMDFNGRRVLRGRWLDLKGWEKRWNSIFSSFEWKPRKPDNQA